MTTQPNEYWAFSASEGTIPPITAPLSKTHHHPHMLASITPPMTRRRFLRRLGFACTLLAVSTALGEQPGHPPSSPKGQRVFYASHSLMWYVPQPLASLTSAAGITGHEVAGVQAIGASRTLQHWDKPEPNQAKQALKTGKIDVFVMSPIQFPDEGVENFVKLGLENNPRMRFIVQLSWGGGDTDNQDFPKGAWDKINREKSPEELQKLYQRNIQAGQIQADDINQKYGKGKKILTLVPTAQALIALRTKIARKEIPGLNSQAELFVDPAHPSAPLEALNTYLHFAVLYGQSPIGLPITEKLKAANRPGWDDKLARTLQEIAWETATRYPWSGIAPTTASAGRQERRFP
jgi:hypothetical protein